MHVFHREAALPPRPRIVRAIIVGAVLSAIATVAVVATDQRHSRPRRARITVISAGPDHIFGTADDVRSDQ